MYIEFLYRDRAMRSAICPTMDRDNSHLVLLSKYATDESAVGSLVLRSGSVRSRISLTKASAGSFPTTNEWSDVFALASITRVDGDSVDLPLPSPVSRNISPCIMTQEVLLPSFNHIRGTLIGHDAEIEITLQQRNLRTGKCLVAQLAGPAQLPAPWFGQLVTDNQHATVGVVVARVDLRLYIAPIRAVYESFGREIPSANLLPARSDLPTEQIAEAA